MANLEDLVESGKIDKDELTRHKALTQAWVVYENATYGNGTDNVDVDAILRTAKRFERFLRHGSV